LELLTHTKNLHHMGCDEDLIDCELAAIVRAFSPDDVGRVG
jgi:hypothetical protein